MAGRELHKTLRSAYGAQVKNNVLDPSKIEQQIGWKCRISMNEGVDRMCRGWNGTGFVG